MSARAEGTEGGVGRRHFMLGASALGAAAMAAWGGKADAAGGGAGRGRQATTQFTLHASGAVINPVDTAPAGASVGDLTYFHADLRLAPGGEIVGHVFGTTSFADLGTPHDAQLGPRITHLIFVSNDLRDQIVVTGVADYPLNGTEFQADQPVFRAIVGGTGLFIGVRGELASTRLSSGEYRQDFTLLQ